MKKNKKIVVFLLGIITIVALSVGLTLAWFTSQDQATNIATMGNLKVELTESSTEPDATVTANGITYANPRMPGDEVSKVVTASNTGNKSVYVRYAISKAWYDPSTGIVAPGTDVSFIELLNIDSSKYVIVTEASTTYYYLKAALTAGSSNTLFDKFKIAEGTTNAHLRLQARISATTDAVQYEYGADAVDAQGWHVHVDSSTLQLVPTNTTVKQQLVPTNIKVKH